MAKGYRKGRLGEEIRKIISSMLLRELTDPALKERMVSISAVDVTPDASYAAVYVTILGKSIGEDASPEEKEEVLAAFKKAKNMIRSEINKKVRLHHVPDLIFKIDTSMEYGRKMEQLLSTIDIPEDEPGDEENAENAEVSSLAFTE